MKLAYVDFDKAGHQVSDTLEAADAGAAAETLRRQGLFVTRLAPGDASPAGAAPAGRHRVSKSRRLRHVAMLTRQLHVLVACGTPLVDALAACQRQARAGPWREALADVQSRVEQGSPLSAAMESRPEYFDAVCRSLVHAGEASGSLAAMLNRVAIIARKQLLIRNNLVGAMIYPCLLMVVAISVLTLMLVLVIPRFGELFQGMGVPLPPTTRVLVALSGWLQSYWWGLLAGLILPAVALRWWLRQPAGRRAVDTLLLRLPQVGRIVRDLTTARIARLLGTLMESRVSVLEALSLTRESVANYHYAALLQKAEEAVTQGKPIHSAFSETDLISPAVAEAIRSGEQTGQVGPLLTSLADFLDEENETVVRAVTSIIEPVILIGMGVLVGTIAVSMFLPLFDLTAMTQSGGS